MKEKDLTSEQKDALIEICLDFVNDKIESAELADEILNVMNNG